MATTTKQNKPTAAGISSANVPWAEQVLAQAQAGRDIIQDFVPLAESLEWELGQEYLRERGTKVFLSDARPVPFVINNDGNLSTHAAEVFFASLTAADQAGTLEGDLFVLELGIGLGLFARFFLDSFRDLCLRNKKNYYDRLCYIAADKSEKMLLDLLRHGVLANHPGRFRIRQVDALHPEAVLLGDVGFRAAKGKPFRAVFLNYLLDCLPAAVLEFDGDKVRQLCVRTCVARTVQLADYTDMTPATLRARVRAGDAKAKRELLEVYGRFASEYDYQPVDVTQLPYGQFAAEYGRRKSRRLLHSYGAIQCMEKLQQLVVEDGFILLNDYGPTHAGQDEEFEHQRFSLATFVGINFPLLKAYFSEGSRGQWVAPAGEERGIHSRLLSHKPAYETVARFYEVFGEARHKHLDEPLEMARACLKAGRFEMAATHYHEAIRRQPRNWILLNEVSMFLTFQLRDLKAGIDMAKVALTLNPTCSADLWNTLGDGLYEFGRTLEAQSAYQQALAVNANDVRARYNLAWVHAREKDYPAALKMLAEAMGQDKTGLFRERLLQKQQEVLVQMARDHQHEYLLLTNLVSRHARPGAESAAEAAPGPTPIDKKD